MSVDAGIRYVPPVGQASDAGVAALINNPASATKAAINALRYIVNGIAPSGGDDLATLQAALNTLSGTGGTYRLQAGTYLISGELDIPANVTLCGLGWDATILQSTPGAAASPLLRLRGDYAAATDLAIDMGTRTASSIAVVFESVAAPINRARLERCRIVNATSNAVRFTVLSTNCIVRGCLIDTCVTGVSAQAGPGSSSGLVIEDNEFTNMSGTNVIQLFNNGGANTYSGCLIANNRMHNLAATCIPIEIGSATQCVVSGNEADNGTRGISTGSCTDLVVVGNAMRNQSLYFMEGGNNTNTVVDGNTAENCAQFYAETAASCQDVTIVGNTYRNSGLSATTVSDVISFLYASTRVRVANNTFEDAQYMRNFVRFGGSAAQAPTDMTIENNTFIVTDPNSPVQVIQLRRAVRGMIRNNRILINRVLVGPAGNNDDNADVIAVALDALSSGIAILENEITYTQSVAACPNHAGIGHGSTGPAALPGLRVRRNEILAGSHGTRLSAITSADQIIEQNDSRTCATPTDSYNAAALFIQQTREMDGTAAPTAGAWIRGDHVRNSAQAVGSPKGWYCTASGTPGTWVSEGNL